MTLGRLPVVGLDQARKLAGAALREVAAGHDPQADKIAKRQRRPEETLGAVFETYQRLHLAGLRPSTRKEIERLFNKRVLPRLRDRPLDGIARRDVIALLDSMTAEAPTSANRLLAALHHFFKWAAGRDMIANNPAAGIARPTKQVSRERVLSNDELSRLWRASESFTPNMKAIVRLLVLTGCRKGEIAGMRERELDGDVLTLAPDRVKNKLAHAVVLSPLALAVLKDVPRVVNDHGFVFANSQGTIESGFAKAKAKADATMLRLAREEAEALGDDPERAILPPWTWHDLRRTFASGLAGLGVRLEVIERTLNHISGSFGGIVGVYQRHGFAEEQRAAWLAWSAHVEALSSDNT
jgi:integrase